ncbi:Phosphoacetylglucosamine mutase [Hibiscus syriacus]|uniref:Phosphoacetylglucosamine mutase n=1 Tax=Hibiscus syriacus TaxID=106335 RepID=A0A6A2YWQ5_HIBSY|nr:phosphoacetylglucosamine mutase-like [Hibiscus syriacus]KAE8683759.1 Phosphoacetylglucosamine mutase [Hibiscus syriacus]
MKEEQSLLILQSASLFAHPEGVKLSYGTAGFRADASILKSTVHRVGMLSALRSIKTQSVVGLMITASHNKVTDNGVKIVDHSGGMLSQEWEPFADQLANAETPEALLSLITEFIEKEKIPFDGVQTAEILLGRDTRPSGESLLEAAMQGISSIFGAIALDLGILTTPQLHWMVRARNKGIVATEPAYFEQISSSFRCLLDLIPNETESNKMDNIVVVDGADGVGGEKLEVLKNMLTGLVIEVRNTGKGGGLLNDGVGADYVQKEKVVPRGFGSDDVGIRCASLDGDADRIVFFTVPDNSSSRIDLVDGDKILSLFALFIKEQLSILTMEGNENPKNNSEARLGVVQTAYANGASTDYLKQLGLEVIFTPTGVKHLHEKAAQFDIGIYFEANGHGTILFSESWLSWLEARNNELSSVSDGSEQQKAALRLISVSKLINPAVGDALSCLLLVEAILQHKGWSIHKWNELYQDLPSRQLKVKVVDRTAVTTTNAETIAVSPPGIQEAIDAETVKYPKGRCFIRPSGTEDVIRVYAEASTQEAADSLADSVAKIVDRSLGFGSSE